MNHATTRTKAVSLLLILAMLSVLVAAFVPFVSTATEEEFQDFSYQTPNDYDMIDATTTLRFLCSVPAGKVTGYTAAGFVMSKTVSNPTVGGDGCATASTTTVYRSVTADGDTVDAPDGRFWVAVKLTNIPRSYFDGTIYVRAYATDGEGTRYSDAKVITVWGANAIEYHSNWDLATRNASEYSIQNPDYPANNDYKTFGIKKSVKSLWTGAVRYFPKDNNEYAGNDLLIEFSFLYNDTMSNASDGTLTVMYIENNNVFNINLKTGKITAKERTGDFYVYPTPADIEADASLKSVDIGEYGWHRFGVRIHQVPINNNGVEDYQIIATAYLDGERILEVDKTAFTKSKDYNFTKTDANKIYSYTGKLYNLTTSTNRMIYDKISKNCDAYVLYDEKIYKSSVNAGYLILQDLSFSCGQTFKQQVAKVADPVSQTYKTTDGQSLTAKVYFAAAGAHEHVWDGNYTITKQPTLFENGWKADHCSVCGAGHAVAVTPSEMTPVVFNGQDATSAPTGWANVANNNKTVLAEGMTFKFLADDNGHFYPTAGNPEGNDLLVEFSVLWNDTLTSWGGDLDLGNFTGGSGSGSDKTTIYLHTSNAQLELNDGKDTGGVAAKVLYHSDSPAAWHDNYSNISGGNGWHRIGLRYHQTAALDGDTVVYTLTYTLYVDGVKINEVLTSNSRFTDRGYKLFTATNDNGVLKYADNTNENTKFHWIQLKNFYNAGSDRCVAFADLIITSGHDFVQQVEPAASPVASPINLGWCDEELMYYKLAD